MDRLWRSRASVSEGDAGEDGACCEEDDDDELLPATFESVSFRNNRIFLRLQRVKQCETSSSCSAQGRD